MHQIIYSLKPNEEFPCQSPFHFSEDEDLHSRHDDLSPTFFKPVQLFSKQAKLKDSPPEKMKDLANENDLLSSTMIMGQIDASHKEQMDLVGMGDNKYEDQTIDEVDRERLEKIRETYLREE